MIFQGFSPGLSRSLEAQKSSDSPGSCSPLLLCFSLLSSWQSTKTKCQSSGAGHWVVLAGDPQCSIPPYPGKVLLWSLWIENCTGQMQLRSITHPGAQQSLLLSCANLKFHSLDVQGPSSYKQEWISEDVCILVWWSPSAHSSLETSVISPSTSGNRVPDACKVPRSQW